MNKDTIIQTLNCLDAEGLIEIIPEASNNRSLALRVKSYAFVYNLHNQRMKVKFLVPTIISVVALIGGYRQELSWLIQALKQLLK